MLPYAVFMGVAGYVGIGVGGSFAAERRSAPLRCHSRTLAQPSAMPPGAVG